MKSIKLLTALCAFSLMGCAGDIAKITNDGPKFVPYGGTELSKEEYESYTLDDGLLSFVDSYKEIANEQVYYYELYAIKNTRREVEVETQYTFTYLNTKSDIEIKFTYFQNKATMCDMSMITQEHKTNTKIVSITNIAFNPIDEFEIKNKTFTNGENSVVTYSIDNSYESGIYRVDMIDVRYDMILIQKNIENNEMISAKLFKNKSVINHEWKFTKIADLEIE